MENEPLTIVIPVITEPMIDLAIFHHNEWVEENYYKPRFKTMEKLSRNTLVGNEKGMRYLDMVVFAHVRHNTKINGRYYTDYIHGIGHRAYLEIRIKIMEKIIDMYPRFRNMAEFEKNKAMWELKGI